MPSIHDFIPSAEDLARWRTEQIFFTGDLTRIAGVSETTVCRWFKSNLFLPGETFRLEGQGEGSHGHRRFNRAGLIRFFREHGMAQALIHIGETPSCYALYVGHDVAVCRSILSADPRELVDASDPFDCGRLLWRDKPAVVIVDFTDSDLESDAHAALVDLCEQILTTTAIDPAIRPAVIGFGIPSEDALAVDIPIANVRDLYMTATKLCGARLSL